LDGIGLALAVKVMGLVEGEKVECFMLGLQGDKRGFTKMLKIKFSCFLLFPMFVIQTSKYKK
jgi:hypothetical protein